MAIEEIDTEALSQHIDHVITKHKEDHTEYFKKSEEWMAAYRDFEYQHQQGPFENASDLHINLAFIYGKATHARLWQIFGQQLNFFNAEAMNEAFLDKEELVRRFMNWTLGKWSNRSNGVKDVFDVWLNDIAFRGSGVLKLLWDRFEVSYTDVVEEAEILEEVKFNEQTLSTDITQKVKFKEVNKERTDVKQAPKLARVMLEDFYMPPGYDNVNDAPWVAQDVYMTDEDLKSRAASKKFDPSIVEEVIQHRVNRYSVGSRLSNDTRTAAAELEGTRTTSSLEDEINYQNQNHLVQEWYGKAYITKKMGDEIVNDLNEFPKEVVVWRHVATGKILGWTYLHRISPSGRRPFYKSDFTKAEHRSFGVGICELLYSIGNHVDAVHNMKMDNARLASLQFGFYRAASSIKPDVIRIQPGQLNPLEDVNDVKMVQFPYLGSFGNQEEATLTNYAEKTLAIGNIQMGQTEGVAGALRNATGATVISRESQIQLNIHFDRIARSLNVLLRDMFVMCRERMPETLVYRVTGENGEPVFGKVNREDLKGDFDFDISIDLLAASETERRQLATLAVQTFINPAFLQTGVVSQENMYNILKNFAKVHGIKRIDDVITKPQGYTGPKITPEQRIFRIASNNFKDPPVESTIRLDENHDQALDIYQKFMDTDNFGLLTSNEQLAAYKSLMQETARLLAAQQSPGIPNSSGLQLPQGGMPAMQSITNGSTELPSQGAVAAQMPGGMGGGQ